MSSTTLKSIIATASLTMPSPKTMEKSLGYLAGLIIVSAATESDAHIVALYLNINAVVNFIYMLTSESFRIQPKYKIFNLTN
jgi:phosphoenolpyruvate-protein kinase (PTS system EI component)